MLVCIVLLCSALNVSTLSVTADGSNLYSYFLSSIVRIIESRFGFASVAVVAPKRFSFCTLVVQWFSGVVVLCWFVLVMVPCDVRLFASGRSLGHSRFGCACPSRHVGHHTAQNKSQAPDARWQTKSRSSSLKKARRGWAKKPITFRDHSGLLRRDHIGPNVHVLPPLAHDPTLIGDQTFSSENRGGSKLHCGAGRREFSPWRSNCMFIHVVVYIYPDSYALSLFVILMIEHRVCEFGLHCD